MNSRINKDIFTETGCIKRELLLRYRDGTLASGEKYEVEKHLVDCPLCSDALEGFMLVTSAASFDDVQLDVSELVNRNSGASFQKYWVAAASVAAIVVLSVFTYLQFQDAKDQRMAAVKETIQMEPDLATESSETVQLSDSIAASKPIVEAPPIEIILPKRMAQAEQDVSQISNENDAAPVGEFTFEVQNQAAENVKDFSSTIDPASPASTSTFSTAPQSDIKKSVSIDTKTQNASSNFITYVDNLKVIDYGSDVKENKPKPLNEKSTSSKYENTTKKQEAAADDEIAGDIVNRKIEYTNLISKPIILFNQGRYESAVKEFDEVLKIHPNDENALFYKGMSLYHLKSFNQSATLLSTVSRNSASPFAEEAAFYVAKSYLGSGEKQKAKVLFQDIVKGNGFYSEQAAQELKN